MTESNEFKWTDKDSVVVERVDAIAVYQNPNGEVVIRQQDPMGDDDSVIVVPKSRLNDLILALQSESSN